MWAIFSSKYTWKFRVILSLMETAVHEESYVQHQV